MPANLNSLLKDGTGKLTFSTGDVYEGTFDDDMITGTGKFTFSNGDSYEGDLVNGVKEGVRNLYMGRRLDVYRRV